MEKFVGCVSDILFAVFLTMYRSLGIWWKDWDELTFWLSGPWPFIVPICPVFSDEKSLSYLIEGGVSDKSLIEIEKREAQTTLYNSLLVPVNEFTQG